MAPLIALVLGFCVARGAGLLGVGALDGMAPALRVGLAVMFVLTGVAHFGRMRSDLVAMVPPRLPRPEFLVVVTGVLELAGAVGLLVPSTAQWAAGGLALLMVAMFPANVYAARHGVPMRGRAATPLPFRTALQVLFIGAATAVALG